MSYLRRARQSIGEAVRDIGWEQEYDDAPDLPALASELAAIGKRIDRHIEQQKCRLWANDGYVYCSAHSQMAPDTEDDGFCRRLRAASAPKERKHRARCITNMGAKVCTCAPEEASER